jgi:hypothetical protein
MERLEPPRTAPWALAIAGGVVALFVAGLIFDLGPFADEPLSDSEYIARADGVCKAAEDAFATLQDSPPQTAREATELTGRLVGIAEDESAELRELEPPPQMAADVNAYLEARDEGIESLRAGHDAAKANDADAYRRSLDDALSTQADRRALARQVGLTECSR